MNPESWKKLSGDMSKAASIAHEYNDKWQIRRVV